MFLGLSLVHAEVITKLFSYLVDMNQIHLNLINYSFMQTNCEHLAGCPASPAICFTHSVRILGQRSAFHNCRIQPG